MSEHKFDYLQTNYTLEKLNLTIRCRIFNNGKEISKIISEIESSNRQSLKKSSNVGNSTWLL